MGRDTAPSFVLVAVILSSCPDTSSNAPRNPVADGSVNSTISDPGQARDADAAQGADSDVSDRRHHDDRYATVIPNQIPQQYCDPACAAKPGPYCVRNNGGDCVECLTDRDCEGNPQATGPRCDIYSAACYCETDSDCTLSALGSRCNANLEICSCHRDADCQVPTRCLKDSFGALTCVTLCAEDADCDGHTWPWATSCNVAAGTCHDCETDADCGAQAAGPYCWRSTSCYCQSDADCAGQMLGHRCHPSLEICGCFEDSDCPSNMRCSGSNYFAPSYSFCRPNDI